jgi:hypothetical protein
MAGSGQNITGILVILILATLLVIGWFLGINGIMTAAVIGIIGLIAGAVFGFAYIKK